MATSTRAIAEIEVHYERDQQALRLLELPSELLASLTSGVDKLFLKSPDQDHSRETVLCNVTKTWALRQVQSSNALLLLSPASDSGNDAETRSMSVFASSNGTIEAMELTDASKDVKSAGQWISDLLPVYHGDGTSMPEGGPTLRDIIPKLPRSAGEVESAWREMAAFKVDDTGFRPSVTALLRLWQDIHREATASGVNLANAFAPDDILDAPSPETVHPRSAYEAVLCKLSGATSPGFAVVRLSREATVTCVGEWLTLGLGSNNGQTDSLLQRWKALLPAAWQADPTADLLETLQSLQQINVAPNDAVKIPGGDSKADSKRKATQRNWHERFKRAK